MRARERERERERERKTELKKEREREREKQKQRKRDRENDRDRKTEREREQRQYQRYMPSNVNLYWFPRVPDNCGPFILVLLLLPVTVECGTGISRPPGSPVKRSFKTHLGF